MAALIGSIAAKLLVDSGQLNSGLIGASAKISQFEKRSTDSFRRFDRAATNSFSSLGRKSSAAFASFSSGLVAPLAGMLTLTALIHGTSAAIEKYSRVADQAAASGLDAEYFQGLTLTARQSGVAIDTTASALANFSKSLGDLQAGRGRLASALGDLSPNLLAQLQSARDTEAAFRAVANALRDAKTDAQAAAIAAAAFGSEGTKMVAAFRGGADAIDLQIAKLREMGVIVGRDVIASADDLGDRWELMAEVIDTKVKTALISLGPVILKLTSLAADLANILGDQIAGKKPLNIPSWGKGGVGTQMNQHLADVLRGMAFPETAVQGLPRRYSRSQYDFGDLSDFFNDATKQAVDKMRAALDAPASSGSVAPTDFDFRALLDPKTPAAIGKVAASANDSTAALAVTSEAVTTLTRNFEQAESMAQSFASTLIDDLLDGKDAVSSLSNAFGQLGRQLIQMAANKAISALFSSLLGSALGGSIAAGAPIPVGGFVPGLTGPKLFKDGAATGPASFPTPEVLQ